LANLDSLDEAESLEEGLLFLEDLLDSKCFLEWHPASLVEFCAKRWTLVDLGLTELSSETCFQLDDLVKVCLQKL